MSIIGTVSHLIGRVVAVKADGSERTLALGDQVFADEMIRVSPDGAIEIAMETGDPVKLDGGQSWLASSETFQEAEDFDLTEAVADIDSIQEAILAGVEPTEVSEATAAGGEAGARQCVAVPSAQTLGLWRASGVAAGGRHVGARVGAGLRL